MSQRYLQQPGPASEPRVIALECGARKTKLLLRKGGSILRALTDALAAESSASAMVELSGARLSQLVYVIPALSPDATHAAWYSDRFLPKGVAALEDATLSFGCDTGKPFIHCHGIWVHADGHRSGGHLLSDETVLDEDTVAAAWIISGAHLDRQADPETNFPLPTPVPTGNRDRDSRHAVLLRIKPNMDIHLAIEAEASRRGIANGSVHGVCSLVCCDFTDGRHMDSFASEAFIHQGRIKDGISSLVIGVTAMSGEVFTGEMTRGGNVTCIANEILIVED